MKEDSDWKGKYQASIRELDEKEGEWQALEDILRKAIGRLSIAGRGIDNELDKQLKEIQQFSRKKQDQKLLGALETLASIIASLDDNPPGTEAVKSAAPSATDAFDSATPLFEMLQTIQLTDDLRAELKQVCNDLLQLIARGTDLQSISPQIEQIATIINSGLATPYKADQVAQTLVFELVSLLELTDDNQKCVGEQFDLKASLTQTELQNLADIINSQLSNTTEADGPKADVYIDTIICSLLERLAIVQGASAEIDKIQEKIETGIDDDEWPDTLNDIVDSVSLALQKLSDEKAELESFILAVTEQLNEISGVITQDAEAQVAGRSEALSLQELIQVGVTTIRENVDQVQDIDQLKAVIGNNIDSIRDGVESFVLRANERHDATDTRNETLSNKITEMELETKQLKQKLSENRKKLLYDTLTGVRSRLAYNEQMTQELARWKRYETPFTYAIIDIDLFKQVNDQYGHSAGDKALRLIAQMMQKQIRKSDTLFRIGGEEFVLLLPNTSATQAEPLITKIREGVAESGFHFKREKIVITLSAGITESIEDDNNKRMYERADAALYKAKNAGRNCQFVA